jgi:hypothetical protein
MAKIEIEFSDVDYQLLVAMATYAKESIEEYCRQIIMNAVSWDLREAGSQPEEKNSTFYLTA